MYEQASVENSELPRYKCHKEVWALKIGDLREVPCSNEDGDSGAYAIHLVPHNTRFAPFALTREYIAKHKPQVGGYWIQYEDGYTSYSPAAAFESGYTLIA